MGWHMSLGHRDGYHMDIISHVVTSLTDETGIDSLNRIIYYSLRNMFHAGMFEGI